MALGQKCACSRDIEEAGMVGAESARGAPEMRAHGSWGHVMVGVVKGFVVILSGIRAGEYSSTLHLNRIPRAAK